MQNDMAMIRNNLKHDFYDENIKCNFPYLPLFVLSSTILIWQILKELGFPHLNSFIIKYLWRRGVFSVQPLSPIVRGVKLQTHALRLSPHKMYTTFFCFMEQSTRYSLYLIV